MSTRFHKSRRLPGSILGLVSTALSFAAPAIGQQAAEPAELPQPRQYTVEIIVFTYEEDVFVGNEIFVPERIEEDALDLDVEVDASVPTYTNEAEIRPAPALEYTLLTQEELTMSDTARMLDRLQAYEPIMHVGWTQTTIPDMETRELALDRLGSPPPDLNGTFKLYLSRYLHLAVELELDAPRTETRPSFSFREKPLKYVISEDRIMKNEDIRYYDHPKFGVIAKVTRVEAEEESVDDRSS